MSSNKILYAVRSTFRPAGETYVRITPEGCVLDVDMHMLKPNETHTVNVCGDIQKRNFQRIKLDRIHYLVDVVTGTLYNAITGKSGSHQLYIVMDADK